MRVRKLTSRIKNTYDRLKLRADENGILRMSTKEMSEICFISSIRDHLKALEGFGLIECQLAAAGSPTLGYIKFTDKNIDDFVDQKITVVKTRLATDKKRSKIENLRILLNALKKLRVFDNKTIYETAKKLGYGFSYSDLNPQLKNLEKMGVIEITYENYNNKKIEILAVDI